MATDSLIMGEKFIPKDSQIGPGPTGAPKGPPKGYKLLTSVTPELAGIAKNLLNNEFGTMIPFSLNGTKYMARLEPHYHPPGYKNGPNGWHKGVTLYENNGSGSNLTQPSGPSKPKINRQKLYKQIDDFLAKFENI